MAAKNDDLRGGFDITFADGVTRKVKALTIRQLRTFMEVMNKMDNIDTEAENQSLSSEDIDNMVEAAAIALSKVDKELAEDADSLEDALDLRCFGQLMAAAMGNNPNL
mgnify:CR=1 FL=1|jgi:hypothetical protein|tara:strand:- start:1411 stop:1734 length:324 start_codon:yes stop_codon:yes gene_type:complete